MAPFSNRASRLLIVDDVADNRAVLGRRLQRRGFEVIEAEGGRQALALIASQPFDLILLDLMMPDLNGFEVLRTIRATRSVRELPVIMVTAKAQDEDIVEALAMGANDYVTKPVAFEVALARIEALTARKHADEAHQHAAEELQAVTLQLRDERDFLQNVFEQLDKGIVIGEGSRLTVANGRLLDLFGLNVAQCSVGGDLAAVAATNALEESGVTPVRARFIAELTAWFLQSGPEYREVRCPDGRVLELRRKAPINGKHIGTLTDVSARATASDRLHQSQKMEALGELAGGVAHEFNNLLQVIGGFSRAAFARAEDPQAVRAALEEVMMASGRAADLSWEMLTFSRNWVGSGKVIAVDEELPQLERLISFESRGIRVEVSAEPDLRVIMDKTNFTQALLNLAINGRDAMSKGGLLSIAARHRRAESPVVSSVDVADVLPPGDYVEIAVTDQGGGVPKDVLPRIFEPFFTTKTIGKGTGLGLSFVFGVVKQAGGAIDVVSAPGRGSTFTILLPRSGKPVSPELRDADYQGGHETILVVDDEPQVRAVTSTLLEELGYTVVQANGGLEALELFDDDRDRIDLILTDVAMPDMDGFDLAAVLDEIGCQAPVGFMTGCVPDLEHQDDRFTAARTNIIQKPFNIKSLAAFTRDVLQESAA
ncbi:MAG: response regulator [Proteobacteria bacterium]|nr:response regulator [Pseudomonadota bacterium]